MLSVITALTGTVKEREREVQVSDPWSHPTVWLTAAEICKETQVFPKLNLLANNSRLVLNLEIIIPPADKLGTVSTCREKQ